MTLATFERQQELLVGVATLDRRLADSRTKLRSAPPWYRPGMPTAGLPPARAASVVGFDTIAEAARTDGSLLARLRRELAIVGGPGTDPVRTWPILRDWLNRLRGPEDLIAGLVTDPLAEMAGPVPPVTRQRANRVLVLRRRAGGRFRDLSQLQRLQRIDPRLLADLFHTGSQLHAAQTPSPPVDVLVPLRIETRFDPPTADGDWQVRLRIIPDDLSMTSHDPLPSAVEVNRLGELWARTAGDLDSETGRAAWGRFVEIFGGRRAAWLVRSFPASADGADWGPPDEISSGFSFSAVAGWPSEIEIWIGRDGADPVRSAVLSVATDQLGFDLLDPPDAAPDLLDPVDGDPDNPDPNQPDARRWWNSFARAVEVGMGTTIGLGPGRPDDIDVIYAVGLGTESPDALFEAHLESARLSILEFGAATNSSDQEVTDEIPTDPDFWRAQAAGAQVPSESERSVSAALLGAPDRLSPLPGGGHDPAESDGPLVSATWSVLWQHSLADLWSIPPEDARATGLWAANNLVPSGPAPSIRVGEQPYAVLPMTDLTNWRPGPGDPTVEADLVPAILRIRDLAARAAERRGTVVGADPDRAMEIVAQPASSPGYASRTFIGLQTWQWLLAMFGESIPGSELADWWADTNRVPLTMGLEPVRRHVAVGDPADLELELITPPVLPDGMSLADVLRSLAAQVPRVFLQDGGLKHLLVDGHLPASLLVRMVARAMMLTAADVARSAADDPAPMIEPADLPADSRGRVESLVLDFGQSQLGSGDSAALLFDRARAGVLELAEAIDRAESSDPSVSVNPTLGDGPHRRLELAFRAVLDSAMYRIDPWVIGVANRRLQELTAAGARRRLGVYGWVDRPGPGAPGPLPRSLVVAPGLNQAHAAAVLRDRSIFDPDSRRWEMNLDSHVVDEARRLGAEIRRGAHVCEALGGRVERIVGDRATIDDLRKQFPIREEHSGRRTCDGQEVVRAALDPAVTLPSGIGDATRAVIAELAGVLDAYADLCVAEAVHSVVSGRGETAGTALDAAAGFKSPPEFDVINTVSSGRAVSSRLLTVIPGLAGPGGSDLDFDTSPAQIAEPSVAGWLATELGAADSHAWSWPMIDDVSDPGSPRLAEIRLADLGFEPIDALAVSGETLAELASEHMGAGFRVNRDLPVPGDVSRGVARRLLGVLGRRPGSGGLRPRGAGTEASTPVDAVVASQLLERYRDLHRVAAELVDTLAVVQSEPPAAQARALSSSRRWGITPLPEQGGIEEQLRAAHDSLAARVAAVPPVPVQSGSTASGGLSVTDLVQAIVTLACPEVKIPILATARVGEFRTSLTAVPVSSGTGTSELDGEWLDVIGGVREQAALLSAFQLESAIDPDRAPWQAWTNRPDDPWQARSESDPIPADHAERAELVAVYGPPGVLDGADPTAKVAVGLLDSWVETIPAVDHTAHAGFGFQIPGARAPQAILLAVPSDLTRESKPADLISMLAETRELARARAVRSQDLSDIAGVAPLTMFGSQGRGAIRLQP